MPDDGTVGSAWLHKQLCNADRERGLIVCVQFYICSRMAWYDLAVCECVATVAKVLILKVCSQLIKPAEIVGLRIRAPANALSTASNWTFNFMVVMVTGPSFENISWGTYIGKVELPKL